MDRNYKPELGQSVFGSWEEKELPEYAKALVLYILKEFERIGHNVHHWSQEDYKPLDMSGSEYKPFDYDGNTYNFKFGEVVISWYKYPGRGMSTNVWMSHVDWINWFDKCLLALRQYEYDSKPELQNIYTSEYKEYLERPTDGHPR